MNDFDVKFTSVKRKDAKVNNEVVSRYVVSFDVTVERMQEAFDIAKDIEVNLGNNLKGQTTLNSADVKVKED